MAWQDRTGKAAYTSPEGNRFEFDYDRLDRSFEKNATAYNFPGVIGTYIQDLGSSDRRYPFRAVFWGADHDTTATSFIAALRERGVGRLEHPRDGTVEVVPFGTVTAREDLVDQANQTIIDVEFWETTAVLFPSGQASPLLQAEVAAQAAADAETGFFGSAINLTVPVEISRLRNRAIFLKSTIQNAFSTILGKDSTLLRTFKRILSSFEVNVGSIAPVSTPSATRTARASAVATAGQLNQALQVPAALDGLIAERTAAYTAVINIATADAARIDSDNVFRVNELAAVTALTGVILSAVTADYADRPSAITSADNILTLFGRVNEWREVNYTEGRVDTGEVYQEVQQAAAVAAGYLVDLSFDLLQERRVVLAKARTIVDLTAELYGVVDSRLDYLINTNRLSGDEIVELPAGKEMVYYE